MKHTNDRALAVLALVFVALFTYWTFNQIKFYRDKAEGKAFENLPDTSSSSTQRLDDDKQNKPTPPPIDTATWTATDYKMGDIRSGSYVVKSGDTLWEISEAVYGNGSMWTNILTVNSSDIGYLPNGQQALIFPGQVLVIP